MKNIFLSILFIIVVIIAGCKKDSVTPGAPGPDGENVLALRDTFTVFYPLTSTYHFYTGLIGKVDQSDLVLVYIRTHELLSTPGARILSPYNDMGDCLFYNTISDDGLLKLYMVEPSDQTKNGFADEFPPGSPDVRIRYEVVVIKGYNALRVSNPVDFSNYDEVVKRYNLQ